MQKIMRLNQKLLNAFDDLNVKKKKEIFKQLNVTSENDITLKRLHEMLRSRKVSSEIKSTICSILQTVGNKKSIEPLIEIFEDEDKYLANGATLALANITSEKALEFLIETLQNSPNNEKRCNAAYILASYIDNDQAVKTLADVLNDKNQPSYLRSQVAESLGYIADSSITNTLAQNLDDSSKEVQFWCIYALWQVSMDTSVIPKLERFIGDKTIINNTWVIEDEAKEAIRFIKARGKILEKYEDKSKVDIWDIHTEVLDEVERTKTERNF